MTAKNNYAVIFDMDGVLVDNKFIHRKAWVEFSYRLNTPITEEDFERIGFGKTNKEYLEILFQREVSNEEADRLGAEKEQLYRDLFEKLIKPVPGLIELLKAIKYGLELKTAVASSAPKSNIDFVVDNLGIRNYFDVLIDSSFVEHNKPQPDIFYKCAELLSVSTKNCLVFEDSLFGIDAARTAGMYVIALTTSHTREELEQHNCNHIITDFSEITVNEIQELLDHTE